MMIARAAAGVPHTWHAPGREAGNRGNSRTLTMLDQHPHEKPRRPAASELSAPFPGKCAGRREATRPFEIRILDSPGSLDDGSGDR